jgi:hypothetical protein
MPSAKSKLAVALGACLLLSGCADYLARRDSVTFGAGNASDANVGIQTIDPFSRNSKNTKIEVDGTTVDQAQRRIGARTLGGGGS